MKFIVTITNGIDNKDLTFNVYETSIAHRWAAEVAKGYELFENDRFQGWPGSNKDLTYYINELHKQVNVVNTYKPGSIIFDQLLSQDTLNYLHKFFEDLRGPLETGTEFYNQAPLHVKEAINMFNVLIHETEHLIRNSDVPTIVGTFHTRPRIPFEDKDYEHFTFHWKYGEVYINYCEVGKTLLDVFKDRDQYVGRDNVRPQQFYSADFMIKFGIQLPQSYYEQRLREFSDWYSTQGFKFRHLSLGMIPVAILEKGEPYLGYNRLKSVCIK
jgi:hypothetical protein